MTVVSGRGKTVQNVFKFSCVAGFLYAGKFCGLFGSDACTGPAFLQEVRRQQEDLLLNMAVAVFLRQQRQIPAVQSGEIEEIAVGIEGVKFVVGLADFRSGKKYQQ